MVSKYKTSALLYCLSLNIPIEPLNKTSVNSCSAFLATVAIFLILGLSGNWVILEVSFSSTDLNKSKVLKLLDGLRI